MVNYKKNLKKGKELNRVKNPKSQVSLVNNVIYELNYMEKSMVKFYTRISHHVKKMQTDTADLIRELLGKKDDKLFFILTVKPTSNPFNEFYNVFIGTVPERYDGDCKEMKIRKIIGNGVRINDEFVKSFMKIYGHKNKGPTGFGESRDSSFVKEWLHSHKGKKLYFDVWG